MAKYRVIVGMNYPDRRGGEKRAEPGDIVDDLPERAIRGLERSGMIEAATERSSGKKAAATRLVHEAAEQAEQPLEIPEKLDELRGED